jgi:hypothetical protein
MSCIPADIGHPLFRKTVGTELAIPFPTETELAKRVHGFVLDAFMEPGSLVWSALSEQTPLSAALIRQDLIDIDATSQFFRDLVVLHDTDELAAVHAAYAELDLCYIQALTAEVLSKVVAYRENLGDVRLDLPVKTEETWSVVTYTIETFNIGQELPVVVLKADGQPSWLVPRGTSPYIGIRQGAAESVLACIQRSEGINHLVIDASDPKLQQVIQDLHGNPLLIAGFSLGGVFAVRLALEAAQHQPTVYTFGAPGICSDLKQRYDSLELPLSVIQMSTEGDVVPAAGRHLIGRPFQISVESYRRRVFVDPSAEHLCMTLNQPHGIVPVDSELEEGTVTRSVVEGGVRGGLVSTVWKIITYVAGWLGLVE